MAHIIELPDFNVEVDESVTARTFKCRTAKHRWLEQEDAAKCCDPRYYRASEPRVIGGQAMVYRYWAEREPNK